MALPLPPCATIGSYRIEAELARGGFGTLFVARDRDGTAVAVKVAADGDADAGAQLTAEAGALDAIGPPSVPRLVEHGCAADGRRFLARSYVSGRTLAAAIRGTVGLRDRLELAEPVLAALAGIHAAGWTHGDVSPSNVLVGNDGAATWIDLGLAAPHGERPHGLSAARGAFAGTPAYMAPERCGSSPPADPSADVYAAGAILHELLAGMPPFAGTERELHQAHRTMRPRPISAFEPEAGRLDEVVLRCLAKSPLDRFPDAAALLAAFRQALGREASTNTRARATAPLRARSSDAAAVRELPVIRLRPVDPVQVVEARARALGATITRVSPGSVEATVDPAAADDPLRRALRIASKLVREGICSAGSLEIEPVLERRRPDGSSRFVVPRSGEPFYIAGEVIGSAAVAEGLPEVPCRRSAGGEARWLLDFTEQEDARGPGELFVGREPLLDVLCTGAARAIGGAHPTLAVVTGDVGLGKTRLCRTLETVLRSRFPAARLVSLRAHEPLGGAAEETLRQLLRVLMDLPAAAPEDQGRELLGARVGRTRWAAVALALGWLGEDAPEVRRSGAAPGVLRSEVVRAGGEAMRAAATAQPLLVVVDDAQFADETTLDILEFATLAESWVPLWVCLVGRDSLEVSRPRLGRRAGTRQRVGLDPLQDADAVVLCRALLAPLEHVPSRAVDLLVRRAAGNPLHLVELVRTLRREGAIREINGSWTLATEVLDRIPASPVVEWSARRELEALAPDLAAQARLAALLAPEFSVSEMEGIARELDRSGVAGAAPMDAGAALELLIAAGLLVGSPRERVAFRHSLVRDVVARTVPTGLAREIHRAALRYYASSPDVVEEAALFRRLRHADAAGLRPEAAALASELGRRAMARHLYLEADGLFSRALDLLEEAELATRLAIQAGRGRVRYRLGRYAESLRDFEAARAVAARCGDESALVDVLLDEATALDWVNDHAASAERVSEARRRAGIAEDPVLLARLEVARGRTLFRAGRWQDAVAVLEPAVIMAVDAGHAAYESAVVGLLLLGGALPNLGRAEEAETALARVASFCERRGDALHLGAALNNRRNLRIARGDLAGAIHDQQEFMRIGRELGMAGSEYMAEYNIAELRYLSGDAEGAEPHVERAMRLEARHPELADRPVAELLRARIAVFAGRLDEARLRLERLERFRSWSASEVLLLETVACSVRGGSREKWAELVASSSRDSLEQEPIEIAEFRAVAALRAGNYVEARRAYDEALARAAAIPNVMHERLRNGLARVPAVPEPILRAIATGAGVGVVLAAVNLFMGLKTGWWDAGTITASVLAFALLRGTGRSPFQLHLAQTTAVAVGAMPATIGLLGALPALGRMGFPVPGPWQLASWGVALGVLGVLLALMLRRPLVEAAALPFPTGRATADLIATLHGRGAGGRLGGLASGAAFAGAFAWVRDGVPRLLPAVTPFPGAIAGIPLPALTFGVAWSPMMAAAGVLIGPRAAGGVLGGSLVAWAFLGPWLVLSGRVAGAGFEALAPWLAWPAVALLVGGWIGSILRGWDRSTREPGGRASPDRPPPARTRDSLELLLLAFSAVVLLALVAQSVFGLSVGAVVSSLVLLAVLGTACARAAGQTDIAPAGQMGQLAQMGTGMVTPGIPAAGIGAGALVSGGASHCVVGLWSLAAGRRLGIAPRPQAIALLAGTGIGAAVAVVLHAGLTAVTAPGTEALPAPAAAQWQAVAMLAERGTAAFPPGAGTAAAIALSLGLLLEAAPRRSAARVVPPPAAIAVGFLVPAHYAIAIGAGAGLVLLGRSIRRGPADPLSVASGALAGESIVGVTAAFLRAGGILPGP